MKLYQLTEEEVKMLKQQKKDNKKKSAVKAIKKFEFSKLFVITVSVMWILSALLCTYFICRGYVEYLDTLLTFVGGPMLGGIIGYMAKSAFENKEKIKKGNFCEEPIEEDFYDPNLMP